jgi:hypothetical protein
LYVLGIAGVPPDNAAIRKAVTFLASTQRADGSWPITRRYHPGAEPPAGKTPNVVPITYFAAAWATLGLVRSVPPTPTDDKPPTDERTPAAPPTDGKKAAAQR